MLISLHLFSDEVLFTDCPLPESYFGYSADFGGPPLTGVLADHQERHLS